MTSKPSGPPSHPSDQKRSTAPWPIPEPADVIHYAYLWSHEADEGRDEARKDRPVVIVVATIRADDRVELLVAPITHSPPSPGQGMLIPSAVKRRLGLDGDPSWIITTEMNRFIWPGPDVRVAKETDTPLYGAIPASLYDKIREEILRNAGSGKVRMPTRTE